MNIHEHQAKELLRGYGVPVLPGFVAWTLAEAAAEAAAGAAAAREATGADASAIYVPPPFAAAESPAALGSTMVKALRG